MSGWYSLVNLPYAKSSSLHEVGFKSRILNRFLVLGLKVVRGEGGGDGCGGGEKLGLVWGGGSVKFSDDEDFTG